MEPSIVLDDLLTATGLREYRLASGLTQRAFAQRVGLSYGSLKKYERDERPIPSGMSLKVAVFLHDLDLTVVVLDQFLSRARWTSDNIEQLSLRLRQMKPPRETRTPDKET